MECPAMDMREVAHGQVSISEVLMYVLLGTSHFAIKVLERH